MLKLPSIETLTSSDFYQVKMTTLTWLWLGLMMLGWIMVTSASVTTAENLTGNAAYFSIRHAVYIAISCVAFFVVSKIPLQWWQKTSVLWMALALVGLVLVLIPGVGHVVNGSARWLNLGIMKFQPSELAKFAAVLYVSGYLIRRQAEVQQTWKGFVIPLGLSSAFVVLLLLEPDFGSVVVMMGAVLALLFLGGVKAGQFFLLTTVTLILGYFVVTAEEYRMQRLLTFMEPFHPDHVYGASYQLAQSLIAFGRGELWGVGFGESIQKLFYLPEAHTDFVFAIWAEETGLIGGVLALSLLAWFIGQVINIGWQAQKQGLLYGGFVCFGFAVILTLQIIINLGVNIGLLPTKGLTLPFFSYGGSSLVMCAVMVAMMHRVQQEVLRVKIAQTEAAEKKAKRKSRRAAKKAVSKEADGANDDSVLVEATGVHFG